MVSTPDDELTRLREERLASLQKQVENQAHEQLQAEEQAHSEALQKEQLSEAMKVVLTPEARERLARLELSRPELAHEVRQQLSELSASDRIETPVSDQSLKNILASLDSKRRDSTIRRI
jgi:programmed cell death protein 5